MKKGVTIKDIAIKLNMSFSTVSKALNDDPAISALTKERVKKLASDWDYIPNQAARHFKQNKSFTIGLIIPHLMDQFFVLAINGIQKIADEEDYHVIISQSNENPTIESKIINLMKRNRVDGVIVAITKKTEDLSIFTRIKELGIPVVFISRPPNDPSFDYVSVNNEDGAFKATELLIKRGHKRIGHLMGPISLGVSLMRLDGYKKALKKYNINFDEQLVHPVDFTADSTYRAMKKLLTMKWPPHAIFAFKNYISLDAIDYLKCKAPDKLEEIDFVGFGNLPLLQYIDVKPIASIDENSYQIGYEAVKLLLARMKTVDSQEVEKVCHIKIPCKLIMH